jgi:metal-dependent amidase/aminoacylase/carboxypeptidase family protein
MKASEDFSFYLQKVPGTFFFLSSRKTLDRK